MSIHCLLYTIIIVCGVIVHCTLYTVYCKVQFTMYIVHCKLYCTLYSTGYINVYCVRVLILKICAYYIIQLNGKFNSGIISDNLFINSNWLIRKGAGLHINHNHRAHHQYHIISHRYHHPTTPYHPTIAITIPIP